MAIILKEWLKKVGNTIQILAPELDEDHWSKSENEVQPLLRHHFNLQTYRLRYQLSKKPQAAYSTEALATRLMGLSVESHSNRRVILNIDDVWSSLWIKKDEKVRAQSAFIVTPPESYFIMLPFLFLGFTRKSKASVEATEEQIEALSKWVQPKLVNSSSLSSIKQSYLDLIKYLDDDIMKNSPHWSRWKIARGLDQG